MNDLKFYVCSIFAYYFHYFFEFSVEMKVFFSSTVVVYIKLKEFGGVSVEYFVENQPPTSRVRCDFYQNIIRLCGLFW